MLIYTLIEMLFLFDLWAGWVSERRVVGFFFFNILFVYYFGAAPGVRCRRWTLSYGRWGLVPTPGLTPGPARWQRGVSALGRQGSPWGESWTSRSLTLGAATVWKAELERPELAQSQSYKQFKKEIPLFPPPLPHLLALLSQRLLDWSLWLCWSFPRRFWKAVRLENISVVTSTARPNTLGLPGRCSVCGEAGLMLVNHRAVVSTAWAGSGLKTARRVCPF